MAFGGLFSSTSGVQRPSPPFGSLGRRSGGGGSFVPSLERSSFGDEEIGSRALTVHEQYMLDPRCLEEIEPLVMRTSLPAAGKTPHDFAPSVRVEEKAMQTADAAAGCRVAGAGGLEEYMLQHGYTDTSCSDPCPPSKRTSPLDDALVETRASIGSGSHSLSSQDSRSTSAWTDSRMLAPVVAEDHRQVRRADEPRPDASQTPSPPQPALPTRMPRGVRVWPGSGRASATSSSFASGDSVSSRSLPMTPASLSASSLKPRCLRTPSCLTTHCAGHLLRLPVARVPRPLPPPSSTSAAIVASGTGTPLLARPSRKSGRRRLSS
mmetsp:Transcript_106893/g.344926  ORF Transcript_106893/g.344926 Transcript_106893/m.344926 type:complete len:322 (-) Transcript_106893:328-1293(-)